MPNGTYNMYVQYVVPVMVRCTGYAFTRTPISKCSHSITTIAIIMTFLICVENWCRVNNLKIDGKMHFRVPFTRAVWVLPTYVDVNGGEKLSSTGRVYRFLFFLGVQTTLKLEDLQTRISISEYLCLPMYPSTHSIVLFGYNEYHLSMCDDSSSNKINMALKWHKQIGRCCFIFTIVAHV